MNILSIVLLIVCVLLGVLCALLLVKLHGRQKDMEEYEKIQQMISAFPQSMFLLNRDKIIIGIYNIMPEAMAGYAKEDIVGHHIRVFADDPESPFYEACTMLDKSFDEVKRTGIPIQFEYMVEAAHFEATITEIAHGMVLSQVRNISKIIRNRQEIEQKNRNYLTVALAAGGLISWHYDVKEDNFSLLHDVGDDFSLDGTNLTDVMNFFVPKFRPLVERLFSDLIHKRSELYDVVVQAYDLNQQIRWQHIYAVPYEYAEDGSVLRIVGFQRDINSEKESEQELILNRKKLEFAIRVAGLQQWEFNINEDNFSTKQGSFPGREQYTFEGLLEMIHPSDHFSFRQALDKIIIQESDSIHTQMRVLRPYGGFEWFTVDAALFRVDEEMGTPLQMIGILNNINNNVKMNNELIELRDKAEESNRLKSSFLANMSHEIRTPLNAIVGFSSLLGQTEDPEEKDEYMKIIENNNELLLTLIDDILDLSRIETGKIKFNYVPISINLLLTQLQQSTQLRVQPGVEVLLEELDEDMVIYSDMTRVTQVVSNFLNNAVKFTSSGSITVGCKQVETGFKFHVTDTGIGISENNLTAIFDRFIKLNPNIQGTGLGLSICSMIVQLLGGAIGAESEEGKGSTFWCILPSAEKEKRSEEVCNFYLANNGTFDSSEEVKAESVGKTILIAEDNVNNFNLYLKLLPEYRIVHAWDGAQAIEMFHKEMPDLIIMDLSMPLMDGFKATSIIREHAPDLPIIAVSASVLPEERTVALSNGFTDFVMKPIEGASFKRLINHYI